MTKSKSTTARKRIKRRWPPTVQFQVRVLGYRDGDDWVSLALEMDIRGYGATPQIAEAEMLELMQSQIEFAIQKDQPELLRMPAEPKYFAMFEQVATTSLVDAVLLSARRSRAPSPELRAAALAIPPAWLVASRPSPRSRANFLRNDSA